MYFLFFSILLSSFTYIIFRAFSNYKVDPLTAVVYSYLVRVVIGFIFEPGSLVRFMGQAPPAMVWLGIGTGMAFMIGFTLSAYSTKILGVATTTIVARMSMVIPSAWSILYYSESPGLMKFSGITMALGAIYFSVMPARHGKTNKQPAKKHTVRMLWLPVLLFVSCGLCDTLLKVSQESFMQNEPSFAYIDLVFMAAAVFGMLSLVIAKKPVNQLFFRGNIIWGIILGIVNYLAIAAFVLALTRAHLEGSTLFPVNSVGIVLFATILSVIIYKEKIITNKIIGLTLAIFAIWMISVS